MCLCLLAWCSHIVGQRRGSKGRRVISHGPRLLPRHGACRRRHGRGVLNASPLRERTGLGIPVFGATFLLSFRTEATCILRLAVLPCLHTFVCHAVVRTHGFVHRGNTNMLMTSFPPFPRPFGLFLSLLSGLVIWRPTASAGANANVQFCILLLETLKPTILYTHACVTHQLVWRRIA